MHPVTFRQWARHESAYVRDTTGEALQQKCVWIYSRWCSHGCSISGCSVGRLTWMINALDGWQHR